MVLKTAISSTLNQRNKTFSKITFLFFFCFRIRFKKNEEVNNNEVIIPALNCIQLFRSVLVYVIKLLRQRFYHMRCCYMFLTLVSPLITGGIPMGGRCLFGSISDIENAFLIRVWRFLNTNENMPLDQNMKILVKTLCQDHATERELANTLPDRGHIHENNRGRKKRKKGNRFYPGFFVDPPSDGVFRGKCLLLALIMARAKVISLEKRQDEPHPDDISWDDIHRCIQSPKNKNTKTMKNKLEAHMIKMENLLNLNGTTLQEVIPKFCNHYNNDIDVFVICPQDSFQEYKYSYPESGSELNKNYKIFLFQEKIAENEYHVQWIDSIRKYSTTYGGLECIFGCKKICKSFQYPHSQCRHEVCETCHFVIDPNKYFENSDLMGFYHCEGKKKNVAFQCPKCNFDIWSEKCMDRHKVIRCWEGQAKCKDCGKTISKNKKHKCEIRKCKKCQGKFPTKIPKNIYELDSYEAIHQCPYKPSKLPTTIPKMGFFTLAYGEEIGCNVCLKGMEPCKLHDQFENAVKMTTYASVRRFLIVKVMSKLIIFLLGTLLRD